MSPNDSAASVSLITKVKHQIHRTRDQNNNLITTLNTLESPKEDNFLFRYCKSHNNTNITVLQLISEQDQQPNKWVIIIIS